MNPSNTQVTPEIKKVIDSNGDGHTVIPTPHTHPLSEISNYPGSESTPTTGSSKLITSGGVKTALDSKADTSSVNAALNGKASVVQVNAKASKVSGAVSGHFAGLDSNGDLTDSGVSAGSFSNRVAAGTNGSIIVADASGTIGRSPKTIADLMPATPIDSTPQNQSTHLVSSKGVYDALNKKVSFDGTYYLEDTNGSTYLAFDSFFVDLNDAAVLDDLSHYSGTPQVVVLDIKINAHDYYHFKTTASLFAAIDTWQANSPIRVNLLIGNMVYTATGNLVDPTGGMDIIWTHKYFTKYGTIDDL